MHVWLEDVLVRVAAGVIGYNYDLVCLYFFFGGGGRI